DQEVDIYVGNYWGSSPGGGNYLTNYTPATIQCCGVDRRDIVSIMFDSATSGISFDYLNTWAVAITMDIFDTGGGLLGSVGVAAGSTWDAVDLTAFSGVGRIDILQGGDGYTWGMDNLTFTSAVPETGTLALLALGLIGVSFAKRKKA
ncbi:MAG: PEP-CTERM sorting domain-containing protein, partial [Proteobacteria bacterium]|nr:PEP-CTERM sorting domain-containing protein [Pseudomonadota bacterium]